MLEAIDYGATDMEDDHVMPDSEKSDPEPLPVHVLYTEFEDLHDLDKQLRDANYEVKESRPVRLPNQTQELDLNEARSFLKFFEELDDHDDVQYAYANFDIPDDVAAELERETDVGGPAA
jgi:transcriptional/translational regulatory protein YebC/TACO1